MIGKSKVFWGNVTENSKRIAQPTCLKIAGPTPAPGVPPAAAATARLRPGPAPPSVRSRPACANSTSIGACTGRGRCRLNYSCERSLSRHRLILAGPEVGAAPEQAGHAEAVQGSAGAPTPALALTVEYWHGCTPPPARRPLLRTRPLARRRNGRGKNTGAPGAPGTTTSLIRHRRPLTSPWPSRAVSGSAPRPWRTVNTRCWCTLSESSHGPGEGRGGGGGGGMHRPP